jgi:hypothetical protein
MPLIYLEHPRHGQKIATMEAEAEYDEQNGWQRYTPGKPDEPGDDVVVPMNHMLGRRRRKEPEHVDDSR